MQLSVIVNTINLEGIIQGQSPLLQTRKGWLDHPSRRLVLIPATTRNPYREQHESEHNPL